MSELQSPIRPFLDYVVLEREKIKSPVGLIIPESAEKRNAPARGTVIATGPNCSDDLKDSIGKTVFFGKFSGDWIETGKREIYVATEQDIIGSLEAA